MEFLGIGPLEILFILLIALILIGPKDMAKTGRSIGRSLRKIVTSPQWKTITQTSREIRNLPNRLIREAGLEEVERELTQLKETTADIQSTLRERTILPPDWNKPANDDHSLSPIQNDSIPTPASSSPMSPAPTGDDSIKTWTTAPEVDDTSDHDLSGKTVNLSSWITPPDRKVKSQNHTSSN